MSNIDDIPALTPIAEIDFTDQRLDIGDTTTFPVKMGEYMTKIELLVADLRGSITTLNDFKEAVALEVNAFTESESEASEGYASLQANIAQIEASVQELAQSSQESIDALQLATEGASIATITNQVDLNITKLNSIQSQIDSLVNDGLSGGLSPEQLANLNGVKGIVDWSNITDGDYSYFLAGDPVRGYATFEGVTYKLQSDAINNDLGEVVGTTARDALDAAYGDYCKIVGGNYWWFDSLADAWVDMGAAITTVPSSAQVSPDDGGAWSNIDSVSDGVSLHSIDGEYEQGVSIVIDPTNGLTYKANTDAVKAAATGVVGDTVDLSALPSASDGSSGTNWILVSAQGEALTTAQIAALDSISNKEDAGIAQNLVTQALSTLRAERDALLEALDPEKRIGTLTGYTSSDSPLTSPSGDSGDYFVVIDAITVDGVAVPANSVIRLNQDSVGGIATDWGIDPIMTAMLNNSTSGLDSAAVQELIDASSSSSGSLADIDPTKDIYVVTGEAITENNGVYFTDGVGGMTKLETTLLPKPTSQKTSGVYTAIEDDVNTYNLVDNAVTLPVMPSARIGYEMEFFNTSAASIAFGVESGVTIIGHNDLATVERMIARVITSDGVNTQYTLEGGRTSSTVITTVTTYDVVFSTAKSGTLTATTTIHSGSDPEWYFEGVLQGTGVAYDSSWTQPDGSGQEVIVRYATADQLDTFVVQNQSITSIDYGSVAQTATTFIDIDSSPLLANDLGRLFTPSLLKFHAQTSPLSTLSMSDVAKSVLLSELKGGGNLLWSGSTSDIGSITTLKDVRLSSTAITGTIADVIHASDRLDVSGTAVASDVDALTVGTNSTIRYLLVNENSATVNVETIHDKLTTLRYLGCTSSLNVTGSVDNISDWQAGSVQFRGLDAFGCANLTGTFAGWASANDAMERVDVSATGLSNIDFTQLANLASTTVNVYMAFASLGMTDIQVNQAMIDLAAGTFANNTLNLSGTGNADRSTGANAEAGTTALSTLIGRSNTVQVNPDNP